MLVELFSLPRQSLLPSAEAREKGAYLPSVHTRYSSFRGLTSGRVSSPHVCEEQRQSSPPRYGAACSMGLVSKRGEATSA